MSVLSDAFDLKNDYLIVYLSFLNAIAFAILFKITQFLFKYIKLFEPVTTRYAQINFISRIVSSIHAVIGTTLAILILCFDNEIYIHSLIYKSYAVTFTLSMVAGYLCYDFVFMLIYKEIREASALLHHVVSIVAYFACAVRGCFTLVAIIRLTSEISTPFVNNRWFMLSLNRRNNKFFLYNAYAVFLAFLLFRITPIIPMWYKTYTQIGTAEWNELEIIYKIISVTTQIPLDALNTIWFYKILQAVLRYSNDSGKKE